MDEETFVTQKFREYYSTHWTKAPKQVHMREFGFGGWAKKIESRHYSFSSEKELNSYLGRNAPLFISYSEAYYRYPAARPIEKKEWLQGDLVFDIDANELGMKCTEKHGKEWVCEGCMERARECALRLVDDFLVKDFNIPKEEIEVNFSGNRGFHIHVTTRFLHLKTYGRKEIADYVNANGLDYDSFFQQDPIHRRIIGPKISDGGWKGRIARFMVKLIKERNLEKIGVHKRIAEKFYSRIDAADQIANGNWEAVYVSDRQKLFSQIVEAIKKEQAAFVDEGVTFDTSKLIRMPDSLHGETGMLAQRFKINELDRYDWSSDPVVFSSSTMKVYVKSCKEFILKGQSFGPYEDKIVELPEYAAIYLICKKAAVLPENKDKNTIA
ncbi:MAG: DNA primase catalytic subunit PriS [Candidatus Micrarchaeota archaeon]|nr:DNA primase catalytic subunit PriS [Candidatus Micrarchaeota archaeon]